MAESLRSTVRSAQVQNKNIKSWPILSQTIIRLWLPVEKEVITIKNIVIGHTWVNIHLSNLATHHDYTSRDLCNISSFKSLDINLTLHEFQTVNSYENNLKLLGLASRLRTGSRTKNSLQKQTVAWRATYHHRNIQTVPSQLHGSASCCNGHHCFNRKRAFLDNRE